MSKIIKFTAEWCGPCKAIQPFVDSLMKEYNFTDAEFEKVDVDHNSEKAEEFEIESIPVFILLQEDKVLKRVNGASEKEIRNLFEFKKNEKMNQILKKIPVSEASTIKHGRY